MKPLSVGNVVSAGLRIYRDNFKKYFKLALISYLWIFVPVYGWAKYSAIMGVISRLAFKEVAEQPETIRDAQRDVEPRKWYFLGAGLLTGLIFWGAIFSYSFVFGILIAIVGAIVRNGALGILGTILGTLLVVSAIFVFFFGIIWLISKLFLIELPLAVEENVNATSAIGRSWQLTKGSVGRIQLIVFLVFLISMPIGILTNILSVILQLLTNAIAETAPALAAVAGLLYIVFLFASSALIVPIWQSIKAVIYYDLRVRREGMGIDLRK